ncbi:protein Lines homolog [Stegastes partitus]|nr:PREDICTED: protein Lines homolog [Stegastes partitus]
MEEPLKCLTDAYGCLLTRSRPNQSAAAVAHVISSGVSGLLAAELREERCSEAELTCISLSLVEKITSSLTSQNLPSQLTLYFEEVLTVLFQDMNLMPQLIHHFQAEDQVISHLAAKCVSTCVLFHLHKSGMVCPVWQNKCAQAFHSSSPGTELDACLWSVTDVLRKVLKESQQGNLGKLLAVFDCSLWALCLKLLPEKSEEVAHYLDSFTHSGHWEATFCLLLDLLEVLSASSLVCGAHVCLKSQRITCIRSAALLTMISCSSEGFLKRRALLLLKKTVLQKVGEDWALGELLSTGLKYENFSSDMTMLAQSVLTAVDNNWLQSVQVEPAAFFGGSRHVKMMGDEGQEPDCVMLRAVSLILLKSIELHIQTAGRMGVDSTTEVYGYLQSLWSFLRRSSVQLTEVTHLCCWISLLFGEQDDDMMEAAKAVLSIFLSQRLRCGLDDAAAFEAACASGCNPHCHFVLLLQSISFDHSILLDFLISTETCFLEYFLRYLKYLRDNWQSFIAACGGISVSDCYSSSQQSLSASSADDGVILTYKGEGDDTEFSSSVQLTGINPLMNRVCLAAEVRLVEYDSSDESDPDNNEDSEVEPRASVCEKSRFSASDVKQETTGLPLSIRQKQNELPTVLWVEPNSTLERKPEGSSLPVLQNQQTSCANMAPLSGQATFETLSRTVLCLSELREVVTRLHTKELFPYNPSSLLKLLAQVDNCYQHSHVSHNKGRI